MFLVLMYLLMQIHAGYFFFKGNLAFHTYFNFTQVLHEITLIITDCFLRYYHSSFHVVMNSIEKNSQL